MVPRRRFSTRGPLSRNANKENYKKKKSDYKRNSSHEFIYARLIDQLSPLHHHAATSLTHRKYSGWEPPMCREPKSGALYSTDFPRTRFPRNARVGAKKNFILNTFSPFSPPFRVRIRESTVSLSLSLRSPCRVANCHAQFVNNFLFFHLLDGKLIHHGNSIVSIQFKALCFFNFFCPTGCIRAVPFIRAGFFRR